MKNYNFAISSVKFFCCYPFSLFPVKSKQTFFFVKMFPKRRLLKYTALLILLLMIYIYFKFPSEEKSDENHDSNKLPSKLLSTRFIKIITNLGTEKSLSIYSEQCYKQFQVPEPSNRLSDTWTTSFKDPYALHIFSAYLTIQRTEIKITGISNNERRPMFCQIWYTNKTETHIHLAQASLTVIPETHGLR